MKIVWVENDQNESPRWITSLSWNMRWNRVRGEYRFCLKKWSKLNFETKNHHINQIMVSNIKIGFESNTEFKLKNDQKTSLNWKIIINRERGEYRVWVKMIQNRVRDEYRVWIKIDENSILRLKMII